MVELIVLEKKPSNSDVWNALARENDNFLQSTFFDEIQSFYQQTSYYFEMFEDGKLTAGVKVYLWESNRLPKVIKIISKSVTILGQILISSEDKQYTIAKKNQIRDRLNVELNNFFTTQRITKINYNCYDVKDIPYFDFSSIGTEQRKTKYNVAMIDLTQDQETLWANVHSKHRNVIRKAEKEGVTVKEENDINLFLDLLSQTYSRQDKDSPNHDFVKHHFGVLFQNNMASIYMAYHQGVPLVGALITHFGTFCDYSFGGSISNSLGAGNLLHWHLINNLKERGYKYYSLGQVALEKDEANLKFSSGISQFKKRFGTLEVSGFSSSFILNKYSHTLWESILKLYQKR